MKNNEEWIIALIQIGLPYLVSIASMLLTYKSTILGHKKDCLISSLISNNKINEIINERKAKLIIEISESISAIENAIGQHTGEFRKNKQQGNANEMNSSCECLSNAIDLLFQTKPKIELLGNKTLTSEFLIYLEVLFSYQREAIQQKETASIMELLKIKEQMDEKRKVIMDKLSSIYLNHQETNQINAVK